MSKLSVKDVKGLSRLFFYFIAVLSLVAVSICILCACNDDANDVTDIVDEEPESVTFILNNGEENIVCNASEYAPTCTKDGQYISAWCTDDTLTHEITFDMVYDLLEGDNLSLLQQCDFKLYAKWSALKNMTGVTMADVSYVYNGLEQKPVISNAPKDATIVCDSGFVDVGEYSVSATIKAYGYNDMTLSCKLTITKAMLDMSSVIFEDKTFAWDGEEKTLLISGELPEGVTVNYENNVQSEVGRYLVTAHFEAGNNYEKIEDKHAFLEIEAKKFDVIFNEEDGTTHKERVSYGDDLSSFSAPKAKFGYLGSWSEINYETASDVIEVFAVYTPIQYGIVYDCKGGELDGKEPLKYTVEESVTLPIPTRMYYEFVGWYTEDNISGDKAVEIPLNITGDKKFYARWTEVRYTVTYEVDGGNNPISNQTDEGVYVYTVNSQDLVLAEPTRKGYDFLRWENEQGIEVTQISADDPQNMTLSAKWSVIIYNVTYVYNGTPEPVQPQLRYTVETGDFKLPELISKGYMFVGWYEDPEFIGKKVDTIKPVDYVRDIMVYAKWEIVVYTVEYVLDDGVNDPSNPTEYRYHDEDLQIYPASKAQYNFMGWFDNPDFDGDPIEAVVTDDCKNVVLYAKFSKIPPFTTAIVNGKNMIVTYNEEIYGRNIVIPEEIDGLKVDGVARGIFQNALSVEILAKWTEVTTDAFKNCTELETLILPSTIVVMNEGMLADCVSLKSLTVPFIGLSEYDGETDGIYQPFCILFGNSDPSEGRKLYSVPARRVSMDNKTSTAIQESITQRYVPKSLKEINICKGSVAKYSLSYLTYVEKISFLGHADYIESFAMRGNTSLTTVSLPPALTALPAYRYKLDKNAFLECLNLRLIISDTDPTDGKLKTMLDEALEKTFGENSDWRNYVQINWRPVGPDYRP